MQQSSAPASNAVPSPDFLAIGHVSRDQTPRGFATGGTVTYAAVTAMRLGLRSAILTRAGPDFEVGRDVSGIPVHALPSPNTTTFRNTYSGGRRTQHIASVAGPITASDVPTQWRSAPMVLLGPLAGELDSSLARSFPDAVVVASLQGWLRQWDGDGLVSPRRWSGEEVLPYVDAAIVSIDDVDDERSIESWARLAPLLIVTMGSRGARLHERDGWHDVPAFHAVQVDPTGAGDVFAAAFLVRYHRIRNPLESARFASCAASFSVKKPGLAGVPKLSQIEERMSREAQDRTRAR